MQQDLLENTRRVSPRETTWQRGAQYFRGLIRPGNNKSIAGIASMVDIKQEKLERFVREGAWEYENVEEHLRQTVPEAAP